MIERGIGRDNSRNVVGLADADDLIQRSRLEIGRDFYQQRQVAALGIDRAQQFIQSPAPL